MSTMPFIFQTLRGINVEQVGSHQVFLKLLFKTSFFFNFKQLGGPAAKNPIRLCARILLSDQNMNSRPLSCRGGRVLIVLLSASVSQPFTQIFSSIIREERSAILLKTF